MSFAVHQYRTTQTKTASPVRVLVQLYDAALRYLREGVNAIETRDAKHKGQVLGKAHAIVSEFQASLDEKQAPEVCAQLHGLYDYCLGKISIANARWDIQSLHDVIKVLEELRGAWAQIAEQQE